MKYMYLLISVCLLGCNNTVNYSEHQSQGGTITYADTLETKNDPSGGQNPPPAQPIKKDTAASAETYANARFKNVSVTKTGENTYTIVGQGQIFEANFGWVIEDGHNELQQGHEMTDAGAPEWGNFKFTVSPKKERPNSSLTLILFEVSAKDGSRVHQLPIPLE